MILWDILSVDMELLSQNPVLNISPTVFAEKRCYGVHSHDEDDIKTFSWFSLWNTSARLAVNIVAFWHMGISLVTDHVVFGNLMKWNFIAQTKAILLTPECEIHPFLTHVTGLILDWLTHSWHPQLWV